MKHMAMMTLSALCALAGTVSAIDHLAKNFATPPASARPWCYWYWFNKNISREGIIADLDGMANAGIGGVYLMNIGGERNIPEGDVKYGTEQWWDLFKLAVSEAAKRNIRFGFHSPGWSASGGPWITPEFGMQELVWSEAVIDGGKPVELDLPRPLTRLDYYRDVAVLAFPQLPDDDQLPEPTIQSPDGKVLTIAPGKPQSLAECELVYPREVTARGLFISGRDFDAKLSYWDEKQKSFKPLTHCKSVHSDLPLHLGAAAFDAVKASKFRLVFSEACRVQEIRLVGGSRISRWVDKTGYSRGCEGTVDQLRSADTEEKHGSAISKKAIVDLSSRMDAKGRLAWTAPAGRWTVLRFGHTPAGARVRPAPEGGQGLECDKMSEEAVNHHYDHCVRPVMERIGKTLLKSSFVNYHVDSYEAGSQTWTKEFPRRFAALRGYDLIPYLPCLTGRPVGDIEQSERFLWDYRRTISDLFTKAHFEQLAKRCAQDGILFSNEPYTGPWNSLQVANTADIPQIEFWTATNPNQKGLMVPNKAGVLAGRANERPIIAAEAFTSGSYDRWSNHPYKIKALGDWVYCGGVNRFVLHVSSHQPWLEENVKPSLSCGGCGTHFDRNNTWWKRGAPEFIGDYLTRCQTILQQGVPQTDVLYFHGDDSPSRYGPFDPQLPEGYDFDACTVEPLTRMKVDKGMLVLPKGKTYRYLVLPSNKRMTLASLKVIHGLAKSGAQVVGCVPEYSPSLGDADKVKEFETLREELRGRVRPEKSFNDILHKDGLLPDFEYQSKAQILHAGHRRIGDVEVYFVANATDKSGTVNCRFRVTGRKPELWYPDTGRIEPCGLYREENGVTEIPLTFDPSGSVFVVFQPGQPSPHLTQVQVRQTGSLIIKQATYSSKEGPGLDVTKPLRNRVVQGRVVLEKFTQLKGDPAHGVVKTLRVDYDFNGKPYSVSIKDGQCLDLPGTVETPYVVKQSANEISLQTECGGDYEVTWSNGSKQKITVPPVTAPMEIKGPWKLNFTKGLGAPEQVELDRLISWSEHPDDGVKFFSGTAFYHCSFTVEEVQPRVYLDLGWVEVIAKITLNGQPLEVLWKPPFRYDVSGKIRKGVNELQVEVINLWPNRMIGDENYPDDCTPDHSWIEGSIETWPQWVRNKQPRPDPRRISFAVVKMWKKGDPLLPSGLLGPVRLIPVEIRRTTFDQGTIK